MGYWYTDYNHNGPSPNLFQGLAVFAARHDAEAYAEKYARETTAQSVACSVHPLSVKEEVDIEEIVKAGAHGKQLDEDNGEDFLPCGADNRWWYKHT